MTVEQLQQAEAAYRAAFAVSEDLRNQRNAAVLAALRDGWTHQQISDATGLSRGRVSQIKP